MNAPNYIQADRILRIDGLLGADDLLAERLDFREQVNGLFEGVLQVRSKPNDIAPDQIVGHLADVSLELGDGTRRAWNVLVTDMVVGPKITRDFQSYRLTLRPQLWLLSQKSDCRIWQDMTSVEVCETLLSEHGLPAPVTSGIVEPPEPQHYSVQYNETDLAYLTRRLEEDGIFHWFTHETGQHVLNIGGHVSAYTGGEQVRFSNGSTDRDHITRFETRFSYTPGVRTARDWNFKTPGMVPEGTAPSTVALPQNGNYELFEYPMIGGYGTGKASDAIEAARVERQSKLRMQASEVDHRQVEGASTQRSLAPGAKLTPYDVAMPENTFDEHVILAIEHTVTDASYETGGNQPDYQNRFIALPSDVPATPHRATPRPRIDGTQVALVAGPEGEEIHPDEYGRIKLWFPWDRRAAKDGSDTCWVRVMQNWAGSGWGGQVIPRIGMEVMVSYLEGDPDRPVVTGVVPNERQTVPYDLPGNKTRSVLRSNTHKGEGFNEISFEDEQGQEDLFLHAQKDMTQKVLNNQSANVGANRVETVGSSSSLKVGANAVETVGRNKNVTVGGGGLQMLSMLAPLMQAGGQMFRRAGQRAGAQPVQDVGGEFTDETNITRELTMLTGNSGFQASGDHLQGQGVAQAAEAASVAGSVGGLIPGSGILNSFIERIRTDTVGVARTEHVGVTKNTVVGNIQNTSVGKTKKLVVGEDYDYEAQKSIFGRTVKHTLSATDTFTISGPGGSLIIDSSGVTIKTSHFQVKSPSVDFTSGSPDQAEALRSDQPFVQDCKGK